jgi:hypothetical protein
LKKVNPKTKKYYKRGDLDSKGNSFWCYQKNMIQENGFYKELWIPFKKIEMYQNNLVNGYKKTCTKCNKKKIAKDNFYKKLSSEDGFDPWCNDCFLNKNRKWFNDNKDHHHSLTANWYENNKEKHLKNSKRIYQANKPRKLLDYYRREERVARATPSWVNKKELLIIYKKAEELRKKTNIKYEVDHIIPLVNDKVCGLNVPLNLQLIPEEQNRRKANKVDLNQISYLQLELVKLLTEKVEN